MRQYTTPQVPVVMLVLALVFSLRFQSPSAAPVWGGGLLRPATAAAFVVRGTTCSSLVRNKQQQLQHQEQCSRCSMFPKEAPDFGDEDDEDEEEEGDNGEDWRSFRAKLVMGESKKTKTTTSSSSNVSSVATDDFDGIGALFMNQTEFVAAPAPAVPSAVESSDDATTNTNSQQQQQQQQQTTMTPLDPSQWAYDSGKVIEQGAVILGGVEQDFGFGLRQQYFHKAAILVLDHEASTFTRGIILNRPTDLLLDDDVNGANVKWRVWFGGDVQGINSSNPWIVCLHSLKGKRVKQASVPVMKDIQWTSFENAKKLVKVGAASPTDFWVFAGYAGWGPKQLMGELERKSWYMVATDSQTLLQELSRQAAGADPRDAGLETWDLLMHMIGRDETAKAHSGDDNFDDLMLKEWALKHLLSTEAGGGAGDKQRVPEGIASTQELLQKDPVDRLLNRVIAAKRGEDIKEGSLVRASSKDRSPFLLEDQQLHKSVILILSDNESITVGAILNRPTIRGVDIQTTEQETGKSSTITLPLRFGGLYNIKGSVPLLWLHCNAVLRAAKIGSPFAGTADSPNGIYKCTSEDALRAVSRGLASSTEFMIVSGVSIWTKGEKGMARGMQGELRAGRFEIVPDDKIQSVWKVLAKQQVLTEASLKQNLAIAEEAWREAAGAKEKKNGNNVNDSRKQTPIGGLGEGYDEEDDTLVFKSDVKVSNLSDDALRTWVAAFLLRAP